MVAGAVTQLAYGPITRCAVLPVGVRRVVALLPMNLPDQP